ncbi:MAG: SDR family oxidoreductase [Opitutaceae bacterium]|nr:SDR family oxidoreductase [Verrucomicrobiales bacterium]
MSADQHSRVIVIVGASGGIGSELARQLAKDCCRLVLCGRSPEKIDRLAVELGAVPCHVDATIPEQVDGCIARAIELHGRVDGVVNCVGSILLKPAHLTSDSEWMSVLNSNLNSAFHVVRSGSRAMRSSGGGSIVLVSSAAARRGLVNHEAIAAAKAGVEGLTLAAAATYAPYKIRVNAVAPGLVKTSLTAALTRNELTLKSSTAMHALGRVGDPADVASAIRFFLDPAQSWVTGQILGVDGGLASLQSRSV